MVILGTARHASSWVEGGGEGREHGCSLEAEPPMVVCRAGLTQSSGCLPQPDLDERGGPGRRRVDLS
jgi:hypothetical protein